MTTLEMALNPLDRYKGTRKPDEVRQSDVVPDKTVEEMLEKYEEVHTFDNNHKYYIHPFDTMLSKIKDIASETILTPKQINQTLQAIKPNDNYGRLRFISWLIQSSYDAGHNDFFLDLRNITHFYGLCREVKGKTNNKVNLTLDGAAGNNCVWFSEHITLKAQKVGDSCASGSNYCEIEIRETGDFCGDGARNSLFKTAFQHTYRQLCKQIDFSKGNTVQLLDANGNILEKKP